MKSKLFILGAASLLLASCSNELDVPVNQAVVGGDATPLSINVLANPTTKALVDEAVLPNNSKIGVKLVKSDGSAYDNQTYNNIFYNTSDGTTWAVDPANKILLSATEGKAYAYFPYVDNASLDFTAIPIESATDPNQQIDYMYGNEATGLKNSNPTASFTMRHAMSIVNFTIAKGTYTGTGSITSVKMKGNTASNTGKMNAVAGTVTATNNGYEFVSTTGLTLDNSSTGKFIVVPSGVTSKLDFKVVMDGQTYTASTTDVKLESGQVYKYTLTMNSTGLTVSQVSVKPWGTEQSLGSGDAALMPFADKMHAGFQGVTTDGVYAVKEDGTPVAYASITDESYAAVAFVLKGKAYQVAKTEIGSIWDDDHFIEIPGVTNYTTVDGTNDYGHLTETGTHDISTDYSTWREGALCDFNGAANTTAIIQGHNNGTLTGSLGKAVKEFREGSNNENYGDWFVPACGELAFMFLQKDKLNTLLSKVSGTQSLSDFYWSSSEYNSGNAWGVSFMSMSGYVFRSGKEQEYQLRLVRAI